VSLAKWPAHALHDPRVVHFWDGEKVVGHGYGSSVTRGGTAGSQRVAWDAYFLYGPNVTWEEHPPQPHRWGSPIIRYREGLRQGLIEVLSEPHTPE
jgi:hypothetical protein